MCQKFLKDEKYSVCDILHFFFIHTSISGHLDCFFFLAIAIPLRAWIYQFLGDLAFISLWYIPASGIAAAAAKSLQWCLDSVRPHRQQPIRHLCPWDSPGKNTGVGCHFLLQCMKVKSLSRADS